MIIRNEHFDQYLQQDEQAFIRLNMEQVRQNTPYIVDHIDDEGLAEMVANGLARARSHGFTADDDLMAFVAVMFEIAPNFDEQPDIKRALANESIPINKRFDSLFIPALDGAWEEAVDNIDYQAWHPGLEEELNELRREIEADRRAEKPVNHGCTSEKES